MAGKVLSILKTLLISYVLTAIILFILSFCLYKFNIADWQVTMGIMITYIFANFLGGYIAARKGEKRRLLWGIGFGMVYFLILMLVSLIVNKGVSDNYTVALRAFAVCIVSGATGAFFTPVNAKKF